MKTIGSLLSIVVLASAAAKELEGADTTTIEGFVFDATSEPVEGAVVSLHPSGTSTVTDASGFYSFVNPELSDKIIEFIIPPSKVIYEPLEPLLIGQANRRDYYDDVGCCLLPLALAGVITDTGGNPIENATVTLLYTGLTSVTDSDGIYFFIFSEADFVSGIRLESMDYEPITYSVDLTPDGVNRRDFTLGPGLGERLGCASAPYINVPRGGAGEDALLLILVTAALLASQRTRGTHRGD